MAGWASGTTQSDGHPSPCWRIVLPACFKGMMHGGPMLKRDQDRRWNRGVATNKRSRFRRPEDWLPIWSLSKESGRTRDPRRPVSHRSLRNCDAQKERHGESPVRWEYVPLTTHTPCHVLSHTPVLSCRPVLNLNTGRRNGAARAPTRSKQVRKNLDLWHNPYVDVGIRGGCCPVALPLDHDKCTAKQQRQASGA